MVVKRVSSDHYMQMWRHLVDNREIIVTGSTNPRFIPPRSPLSLLVNLNKMLLSFSLINIFFTSNTLHLQVANTLFAAGQR